MIKKTYPNTLKFDKNTYRALFFSLLGHFLICFSLTWLNSPTSFLKNGERYLSVYQYSSTLPHTLQRPHPKLNEKDFKRKNLPATLPIFKPSRWSHNQINDSNSTSENLSSTTQKNSVSPLLKLIHNATAQTLIYPETAQEFRQTGIAKIGFILSPVGNISGVVLLKSTGFRTLDNAALDAVRAISPLKDANLYLKKDKKLAVEIVFKDI